MGWVPCYESANEGDARTVLALLEGRGFPCRLESLGGSVLPTMGFAVFVPADQVEAAQELIDSDTPGDAEAVAEASEPEVANPAPIPESGPGPIDVLRRALRFIRAYPSVLLTGASGVLTGLVSLRAIPSRETSVLTALREHAPEFLLLLIVGTVVHGLAIAFVDEALDGRPSWGEAARRMKEQLARLFACQILLSLPSVVGRALRSSELLKAAPASWLLFLLATLVFLYVMFRLTFVSVALLVDRTDIAGAFRGSWTATGRAAWVVLALMFLGAIASLPFALVPWSWVIVQPLLSVVGMVAWVIAYRAATGHPTASSGTR